MEAVLQKRMLATELELLSARADDTVYGTATIGIEIWLYDCSEGMTRVRDDGSVTADSDYGA